MLQLFRKYISFGKMQEDLRKAGLGFIMAGVIALFLERLVSINLALWLTPIGFIIWLFGLVKK